MRNLTIVKPKQPAVAWAVLLAVPVSVACGTTEAPGEIPDVKPSFETSTLLQEPVPQNLTEALDTLDRASSGALLLKMRNGEENVTSPPGFAKRWKPASPALQPDSRGDSGKVGR